MTPRAAFGVTPRGRHGPSGEAGPAVPWVGEFFGAVCADIKEP
jgi:hypothetical protein